LKEKGLVAGYESRVFKLFEPIIGYKQPIIASALLPSGALVAHPIEQLLRMKIFSELKVSFEPMIE
jgi:hypothetical protein